MIASPGRTSILLAFGVYLLIIIEACSQDSLIFLSQRIVRQWQDLSASSGWYSTRLLLVNLRKAETVLKHAN